jgi:hypothetical protein
LVGFFLDGKPFILRADTEEGVNLFRKGYVTAGVGHEVSKFVLGQALDENVIPLRADIASAYAIYSIVSASEHSTLVGGKTRILSLHNFKDSVYVSGDEICEEVLSDREVDAITEIVRHTVTDIRRLIKERMDNRFCEAMEMIFRKRSPDETK